MSRSFEQQELIEAFLQLCPESVGLNWDLATSFEEQGHELAEQKEYVKAFEKYRACVHKKCSLLDCFEDDPDQWDKRRLEIMETCLNLAELQKSLNLSLEIFKTLTIFYNILNKRDFTEPYKHKSEALLSKVRYLFPVLSANCE